MEIFWLLGIPLAGGIFLALWGSRAHAPEINALFSFLTLLASAVLTHRIIEDGPVRAVIEAVLAYGDSRLAIRYKVPKRGAEVEVEARVFWAERDRMLKLSLPSKLRRPRFMGQVAFGADELPSNGDEAVAQKWLALVSDEDGAAMTVANDGVHGSDWSGGELRLSLLRSPAYAAAGRLRHWNFRTAQRTRKNRPPRTISPPTIRAGSTVLIVMKRREWLTSSSVLLPAARRAARV